MSLMRFWSEDFGDPSPTVMLQFYYRSLLGYAQAVQTTELEFHIDLLKVCILNSFVMIFEGLLTK